MNNEDRDKFLIALGNDIKSMNSTLSRLGQNVENMDGRLSNMEKTLNHPSYGVIPRISMLEETATELTRTMNEHKRDERERDKERAEQMKFQKSHGSSVLSNLIALAAVVVAIIAMLK